MEEPKHFGIFEPQRLMALVTPPKEWSDLTEEEQKDWSSRQHIDFYGEEYLFSEELFFFYRLKEIEPDGMRKVEMTCIKRSNYRKLMLEHIFAGYRSSFPSLIPKQFFVDEVTREEVIAMLVTDTSF